MEIPDMYISHKLGDHRDTYMESPLSAEEKDYFGHIEDVLKLVFSRHEAEIGNEGHTITNSRFGDVFDIIYEDASDETLKNYAYLIDATKDGDFIKAKIGSDYKILESADLTALEQKIIELVKNVMPLFVDGLHWLVSIDENGKRYLSIFNNEGNERSLEKGDIIHHEADKTVNVTFKTAANLNVVKEGYAKSNIEKVADDKYRVNVPAASFVIFEF